MSPVTRQRSALTSPSGRGTKRPEDLLGEVRVAAFESWRSYDRSFAEARLWLYGAALNRLRHYWRSRPAEDLGSRAPNVPYFVYANSGIYAAGSLSDLRTAITPRNNILDSGEVANVQVAALASNGNLASARIAMINNTQNCCSPTSRAASSPNRACAFRTRQA